MMIFLKLLLSSGLMFIAETTSICNESSLCYLPAIYIKPIHYDIKLISYIEGHIFYGEYNISISIPKKTEHIFLHSEILSIKNIVLFTNVAKYHENATDTVYKPIYDIEENILDVYFIDELPSGIYTLNIKYYGTADEVFRIFDIKGKIAMVAAIHFHITGARRLSSCWDQENLLPEATFNISIGCNQCTALSNMPLRNMEKTEHMLWTHFHTTPAMSPYLATMIVSNYLLRIDNDTRNIEMWCRNESGFYMKFAENVAENITLCLKIEWKQRSNNISKVTHVAIPNFRDSDTIVSGLVFYKETDIIYDKNLYPIAHKLEVAQLVGCKVTQEWFNNMLNDPLVSDFWFKKGFITLLATNAVNKMYPDYRIMDLFVVQNRHYSFNLDGYYMRNSTLQVNSSLEIPDSIRALFILRMVQHVLTEDIFQAGINVYIHNKKISHSLHFLDFMENVASITDLDMPLQLTKMKLWDFEKHCPLIKVVRNYNDPMSQATVTTQYIDILKIRYIPITFTTEASPDFNNFNHHYLYVLRDFKLSLPFKENGWMIFNIQQVGYYRVNYDEENWRRISSYLRFDNYMKIHVLNRAQVIDDAFHLMITGQLQLHIFRDLIRYLHREEDYIAWYPMFKAMEYMYGTCPWEDIYGSITLIVRYALQEVLKRIKYEEIDDIDELRICLRQEAAKWACFLGDIDCKKEANKKLEQHLLDPTKHKLLPWWQEWTYCNGLKTITNKLTWQLVYNIGYKKSDTKFIEYLACSEFSDIITDYLSYKSFTKQENQYLFNSYFHIITKHTNNRNILMDILNKIFLNIRPKHVDVTAALIIIINNVYSVNLTEEIKEYVIRFKFHAILSIEEMEKKDSIMLKSDKVESKISIRNYQIEKQRQSFDNTFY
ncbi:aminopeptidase N-like [Nylanderia fulva]|uniref:aminopeptidase N-like n=1 Tax=Nylanderia fulva TaxID=613905 RepID=UPI0010FBA6B1|nr:aminopeptidase N-like [Nylanderia fulva]